MQHWLRSGFGQPQAVVATHGAARRSFHAGAIAQTANQCRRPCCQTRVRGNGTQFHAPGPRSALRMQTRGCKFRPKCAKHRDWKHQGQSKGKRWRAYYRAFFLKWIRQGICTWQELRFGNEDGQTLFGSNVVDWGKHWHQLAFHTNNSIFSGMYWNLDWHFVNFHDFHACIFPHCMYGLPIEGPKKFRKIPSARRFFPKVFRRCRFWTSSMSIFWNFFDSCANSKRKNNKINWCNNG